MTIENPENNKYGELEFRLEILENKIENEISNILSEARGALNKASEYRNKAEERFQEADEILQQCQGISSSVVERFKQIEDDYQKVAKMKESVFENSQSLKELLEQSDAMLTAHPNLKIELADFEEASEKLDATSSKSIALHRNILSIKNEVDDVHKEIFGYEDETEEEEIVYVEGLKDRLNSSYDELYKRSVNFTNELEEIKNNNESNFNNLLEEKKKELTILQGEHEEKYSYMIAKIEALLPSALTTGLSKAFVDKKTEEESNLAEHKANFQQGIQWLSWSALLPIAISVIFLIQGQSFGEVIANSPKIAFTVLPLYIPLIWKTISANKKVNLSKRLIEEYSHKQVLSMTIEGLSKQIEQIDDEEISEKLRIELLQNFLTTSNENPGKLISNYEVSDNPLMNLIEKKQKLEKAQKNKIVKKEEGAPIKSEPKSE